MKSGEGQDVGGGADGPGDYTVRCNTVLCTLEFVKHCAEVDQCGCCISPLAQTCPTQFLPTLERKRGIVTDTDGRTDREGEMHHHADG